MKRPAYHGTGRGPLEVKMTPMIDVVFLLLIFFIWTSNFQEPEQVMPSSLLSARSGNSVEDIELPPPEDLERIIVKIGWQDGAPYWLINERLCQHLGEVHKVLSVAAEVAERTDLPVILDINGSVPLGHVIDVYDLCREIGFIKVQFAASVRDD